MPAHLGHWEQLVDPLPAVSRVTCDGGVGRVNPSPYGGSWAWRARGPDGQGLGRPGAIVAQAAGVVMPADVNLPTVSNNLTEVLAVLIALEWVPAGWSGEVRTDSLNALRVFFNPRPSKPRDWLPPELASRVIAACLRAGKLRFTLLSGHPMKADRLKLAAGENVLSKRGYPYCLDNVWADEACGRAWDAHEEATAAKGS